MRGFHQGFRRLDVDAMVALLAPGASFEIPGFIRLEGRDSIRFFLVHLVTALTEAKVEGAGDTVSVQGTAVDGARFAATSALTVEEDGGRVVAVRLEGQPEKWKDLLDRAQKFAARLDFQMD